jgi:hypothetical protein
MKVPVWSRTIHNSGAVGRSQVNRSTKCRHRRRGGAGDSDGKRRATVSRSSSTRARHGPGVRRYVHGRNRFTPAFAAARSPRSAERERSGRGRAGRANASLPWCASPIRAAGAATRPRAEHGGPFNMGLAEITAAIAGYRRRLDQNGRSGLGPSASAFRSEAVFGETGPRSPNTASRSRVHQVCFRHPDPAETRPGKPIESVRY